MITKKRTLAVPGALLGGLSSLMGALYGMAEAKAEGRETQGTGTAVLAIAGSGAVLGGLVGAMFKRDILVYKSSASISVYPALNANPKGGLNPMVALNIKLKAKE
jgi:hypothetical protein